MNGRKLRELTGGEKAECKIREAMGWLWVRPKYRNIKAGNATQEVFQIEPPMAEWAFDYPTDAELAEWPVSRIAALSLIQGTDDSYVHFMKMVRWAQAELPDYFGRLLEQAAVYCDDYHIPFQVAFVTALEEHLDSR